MIAVLNVMLIAVLNVMLVLTMRVKRIAVRRAGRAVRRAVRRHAGAGDVLNFVFGQFTHCKVPFFRFAIRQLKLDGLGSIGPGARFRGK